MALLALAVSFTGCGDDDDDPDTPTTQVQNGFYLVGAATSAEPVAEYRMAPGRIDKFPDAVSRTGLFETYTFLSAGSFNVVQYRDNAVAATLGGTLASRDFSAEYQMQIGDLTDNGPAINVTTEGLYHVTFDDESNKLVVVPVQIWGVIGNATPGGWGSDTPLELVSATKEEVVFRGTGIAMNAGEFKIRYNKNWSLDLSADVTDLKLFTNFGGSVNSLQAGGANIPFAEADRGLYTVTVTYRPGAGNSITLTTTRTGDIPANTYDPANFPWALIGAATVTGWTADSNLTYFDWSGNWVLGHSLTADVFKYRVGEWVQELNPGNVSFDNIASTIRDNGDGNFACSEAGPFFSSIRTDDEGQTWKLKIQPFTPEVIGNATPNGNFDTGVPLTYVGETAGTYSWTISGAAMTADIFKFRTNAQWEIQAAPGNTTITGAKAGDVSADGDNMRLATAGNYTLTISTSDFGKTWTLNVE